MHVLNILSYLILPWSTCLSDIDRGAFQILFSMNYSECLPNRKWSLFFQIITKTSTKFTQRHTNFQKLSSGPIFELYTQYISNLPLFTIFLCKNACNFWYYCMCNWYTKYRKIIRFTAPIVLFVYWRVQIIVSLVF